MLTTNKKNGSEFGYGVSYTPSRSFVSVEKRRKKKKTRKENLERPQSRGFPIYSTPNRYYQEWPIAQDLWFAGPAWPRITSAIKHISNPWLRRVLFLPLELHTHSEIDKFVNKNNKIFAQDAALKIFRRVVFIKIKFTVGLFANFTHFLQFTH